MFNNKFFPNGKTDKTDSSQCGISVIHRLILQMHTVGKRTAFSALTLPSTDALIYLHINAGVVPSSILEELAAKPYDNGELLLLLGRFFKCAIYSALGVE